jgi:hypothetical protein
MRCQIRRAYFARAEHGTSVLGHLSHEAMSVTPSGVDLGCPRREVQNLPNRSRAAASPSRMFMANLTAGLTRSLRRRYGGSRTVSVKEVSGACTRTRPLHKI